jgi:hypothetical protein
VTGKDEAFDAWLAEALAPAERPADPAFVARVDRAIAAEVLYARQRGALWRRFGGELLAIAAIGASLAVLAGMPGLRALLNGIPGLTLPALLALPLLLFWFLMTKVRPAAA